MVNLIVVERGGGGACGVRCEYTQRDTFHTRCCRLSTRVPRRHAAALSGIMGALREALTSEAEATGSRSHAAGCRWRRR